MKNARKNHQVCALAYNGLCTFEFGIAVEAFALKRPELEIPWYDFKVVSHDPSPLNAIGGIQMNVAHGLNELQNADTIIIPGWKGPDTPVPSAVIDAIVAARKRGCRIVSICSGVFVIAATGLLNNKPATTHWRYSDKLTQLYPEILTEPDVLYVEAGNNVFTSAGSAAGLDLCLHLIRLDHGAAIANTVARRFVMPAHRQGGQAQFIEQPVSQTHNDLSPVLDHLHQHLDQSFTIKQIAAQANMSTRTLIRHFKKATGLTPQNWLTNQRLKQATEMLEISSINIDTIAQSCGFKTPETFRHHFRKKIGTSPSNYRKSFSQSIAAQ